jgi:hypothetical protein
VEAAGVELEAICGRERSGSPQPKSRAKPRDLETKFGGGGGSRTRVRKCYWSRDYMLIPVHAPGVWRLAALPPRRSRLRAQNGQETLAASL